MTCYLTCLQLGLRKKNQFFSIPLKIKNVLFSNVMHLFKNSRQTKKVPVEQTYHSYIMKIDILSPILLDLVKGQNSGVITSMLYLLSHRYPESCCPRLWAGNTLAGVGSLWSPLGIVPQRSGSFRPHLEMQEDQRRELSIPNLLPSFRVSHKLPWVHIHWLRTNTPKSDSQPNRCFSFCRFLFP